MKKKCKKLRTYIVTYEPDDCYDYIEVKAYSRKGAKKKALEDLEEYQIMGITRK